MKKIFFILLSLFVFDHVGTSQDKVGININPPTYTLDIRSLSASDSSELNLSTSDNLKFLRLMSGHDGSIHSKIIWPLETSLLFGLDLGGFNERIRFDKNGNIGINNSAPAYEIDARGRGLNDAGEVNVSMTDNSSFLRLFSGRSSDAFPKIIWKDGKDLLIGNDDLGFTEKMRIQSDGEVGIGSFNPGARLDVNGKIKISDDTSSQVAGQIRWNNGESDFEGYDGENWNSLTSKSIQGSVSSGQVRDIEGNIYKTVVIGTQEWMAENLRTTKFNDGTNIPYSPHSSVLKILDQSQSPAYTWPDSIPANAFPYGALYNGYAPDSAKLCPTGWHLPNDAEWTTLFDFLGGTTIAGGKMKSTGTLSGGDGLWKTPNNGASNSSGFSAVPAGSINNSGVYGNFNFNNDFWSGTEPSSSNRRAHWLNHASDDVFSSQFSKIVARSIRCIKD